MGSLLHVCPSVYILPSALMVEIASWNLSELAWSKGSDPGLVGRLAVAGPQRDQQRHALIHTRTQTHR